MESSNHSGLSTPSATGWLASLFAQRRVIGPRRNRMPMQSDRARRAPMHPTKADRSSFFVENVPATGARTLFLCGARPLSLGRLLSFSLPLAQVCFCASMKNARRGGSRAARILKFFTETIQFFILGVFED